MTRFSNKIAFCSDLFLLFNGEGSSCALVYVTCQKLKVCIACFKIGTVVARRWLIGWCRLLSCICWFVVAVPYTLDCN